MVPMKQAFLLSLLVNVILSQNDDGYTDQNRPYEFGFLIEGEQHRYEKKDEKGIIMGEFGFITADGVYHVTVYATDENGNFRILKTRNIKIGLPMPTPTTKSAPPTVSLANPTGVNLNGLRGCSGCLIPTNSPQQANSKNNVPLDVKKGLSSQTGLNKPAKPNYFYNKPAPPTSAKTYNKQLEFGPLPGKSAENNINTMGGFNNAPVPGSPLNQSFDNKQSHVDNSLDNLAGKNGLNMPAGIKKNEGSETNSLSGKTASKSESGSLLPQTNKRLNDPAKQDMFNTPGVSERKDLTDTDMKILDFMARLYKFNYTVTFHGHEEEGDVAGNKRGSYFNNGRDGQQRRVAYIANEFGYQPVVTMLDLNSDETPNELTEKEFTQLKGSEFIWFYNKIKR